MCAGRRIGKEYIRLNPFFIRSAVEMEEGKERAMMVMKS